MFAATIKLTMATLQQIVVNLQLPSATIRSLL